MNHKAIYNRIIENRKQNPLSKDEYGENHHIIPKSIAPELAKDKENIVRLTAQEHFLCHYHLWKHYQDELKDKTAAKKMCFAFHRMKQELMKCDDIEEMSKLYEEVRVAFSENQTGEKNHMYGKGLCFTQEMREKMSMSKRGAKNPMYGKHLSEEHRQKISESNKGHIGYWRGKKQPKAAVEKAANKRRGQKRTTETRKKMSAAQKGLKWWTNGEINSYSRICPNGFWRGMTRKKNLTTI